MLGSVWVKTLVSATEWGWGIKNEQMELTKTDLECAPSELLSLL